MKYSLSPSNYTFNSTAKTITFSGTVPPDINNIMHVANITRGVIYFQPQAGSDFSGSYSSPVLTLNASTTGHSNTDKLLVVYDDGLATTAVSDNGGSLTVDSKAYRSSVTITRPSNTTAYAAGDVVGDTGGSAIITLTNMGPSNGFILIQSISLVFSDSTIPSGMGAFRVHFYSSSPTAIADNAAFNLVSGDRASYVGFVDLPTPQDFGNSLYTQTDYSGRLIRLASASTSLFAQIETRNGYTPVSASTVELRVNTLEAGL